MKNNNYFQKLNEIYKDIFPLSERKTSKPFTFASTAAPTPLSPPPNTTSLDICTLLFCSSPNHSEG